MDEDADRAYFHVTYDVAQSEPATGPAKAIDWGITEVATDNEGRRYGVGYGEALQRISAELTTKGRRRNKLRALSKKCAGSKKARRIARRNLGTKKQARRRAKARATLQTITGCAVKEIVYGDGNRTRARGRRPQHPAQRPSLIVHEDLAHLQGKAKSKKMSRLTSAWMRSELESRMVVHAYRGSSSTKAVNAAYTSQTCPEPSCGYVSSENRKGDMFHCRNPYWACDWRGGADQVAATNLLARAGDREITNFTPYTKVKSILVERFQRRLESRTEGTSTVMNHVHQTSADGYATAHGRTPSTPQQHFAVVGSTIGAVTQGPVHPAETGATLRLESEKKRNT